MKSPGLTGVRSKGEGLWDCQVGRRMERENNKRDILIEGTIMRLGRDLVLGKFTVIHKDYSR